MSDKIRVAILGSGNVGIDLLMKVMKSTSLECKLLMGRNLSSPGMKCARDLGVKCSDQGVLALLNNPDCCEIVFDATSAKSHFEHWPILKKLGKKVIDMTPSNIGIMAIPTLNSSDILNSQNVNMVSCGGQASVPIAQAVTSVQQNIDYIEVVSSISSRSAGPATRLNLDEYVETTEAAILKFTSCREAKTLLNLNPADPPIHMQTTISFKIKEPDMAQISQAVKVMVQKIQTYVPGYEMIVPPVFESNRVVVMVRVTGSGDYLASYAGNLDIINCAAIAVANFHVN